jgi:hypothetical protein
MSLPLSRTGMLFSVFISIAILQGESPKINSPKPVPRVQVAILLDVSNSMDGLIEQAKGQLWNMVKILSRAKCDEINPAIEIALYEYGRPENGENAGYIKQISGFTNDLDQLSRQLYALSTHGGDEYCGLVIYKSLTQLTWDSSASTYKVIFIAGNEGFVQGPVPYVTACAEARKKGVIINTIYCGLKEHGVSEKWDLGTECNGGTYSAIDQDAREPEIATPYDSAMYLMKEKLNETYLAYGPLGKEKSKAMYQADTQAVYNLNDPTKISTYIVVKASSHLNYSADWDLIDARTKDSTIVDKVDMQTLADSLKNKTRKELKQLVDAKAAERKRIQKEIMDLSTAREAFITAEKAKRNQKGPETLETAMERIIRTQAKRFNMKIE